MPFFLWFSAVLVFSVATSLAVNVPVHALEARRPSCPISQKLAIHWTLGADNDFQQQPNCGSCWPWSKKEGVQVTLTQEDPVCRYTIEGGWVGEPALVITRNKKSDIDGSAWDHEIQVARENGDLMATPVVNGKEWAILRNFANGKLIWETRKWEKAMDRHRSPHQCIWFLETIHNWVVRKMEWYAVYEGIVYPHLDYTNIVFREDWDGPEDVKFINWPDDPVPWVKGVRVPHETIEEWRAELKTKNLTPFGGSYINRANKLVTEPGWCQKGSQVGSKLDLTDADGPSE